MFAKLIDRILMASWERVGERRKRLNDAPMLATQEGPPMTNRLRQFTIHEAINGTYIDFMKRKYNPNGPDEFQREVYIVKDGEALVDAISTVLVLTEK
jgi:hypothetical protein